jgi:molecular chaperone DnaK (HSP70)
MRSRHNALLTFVAAAALTLSVSAQEAASGNQQDREMQGMQGTQPGQAQRGGMRGQRMNTMMESCRNNMQSMMQSNDRAQKEIAAAKQSNDPAKMSAALATAEKALSAINDHMKTCMSMMTMMHNMQGMVGMMGGQQSPRPSPQQ